MRTFLLLVLALACGKDAPKKVSSTTIGEPCSRIMSSLEPPDCAPPLTCSDVIDATIDECTAFRFDYGGQCPPGTLAHDTPSLLTVCMPKCGSAACLAGWTCQGDGVCAPH